MHYDIQTASIWYTSSSSVEGVGKGEIEWNGYRVKRMKNQPLSSNFSPSDLSPCCKWIHTSNALLWSIGQNRGALTTPSQHRCKTGEALNLIDKGLQPEKYSNTFMVYLFTICHSTYCWRDSDQSTTFPPWTHPPTFK